LITNAIAQNQQSTQYGKSLIVFEINSNYFMAKTVRAIITKIKI